MQAADIFRDVLIFPSGAKLVKCSAPPNPRPCQGRNANLQTENGVVANEYESGGEHYMRLYKHTPYAVAWYRYVPPQEANDAS